MSDNPDEALWQAAKQGDLAAVNAALEVGAQVTARGEFGDSALNLAADGGHLAVVERLLQAGADLENRGGAGKTPLMNAVFSGQTAAAKFLIGHGARLTTRMLASLEMKVNIMEENAAEGSVTPAAATEWRNWFEYLAEQWELQNPEADLS